MKTKNLIPRLLIFLSVIAFAGCSNTPFNKDANLDVRGLKNKLITPLFTWEQETEYISTEQTIDEAEEAGAIVTGD